MKETLPLFGNIVGGLPIGKGLKQAGPDKSPLKELIGQFAGFDDINQKERVVMEREKAIQAEKEAKKRGARN